MTSKVEEAEMGAFKDSVRDIFGRVFRHEDLDAVFEDDFALVDANMVGLTSLVGESDETAISITRPVPLVEPEALTTRAPLRLEKASSSFRTDRPTPSVAARSEQPRAATNPIRDAGSQSNSPLRLGKSSTRPRVRKVGSTTRGTLGASRTGSGLAPITGGVALAVPLHVGAAPRNFWDAKSLAEEVASAIEGEIKALRPRDPMIPFLRRLSRALSVGPVDLPPLPPAASRLLDRHRPPPDDDELVALIRSDPALAGRIVKLANSPFYLSAKPIASLNAALMRIGLEEGRRVAVAAAMQDAIPGASAGPAVAALREHSVMTGYVAESLASTLDVDPGEAFLSGLVHDTGEILVRRFMGAAFATDPTVEERIENTSKRYHLAVGAMLFAAWDLAPAVAAAVAFHHHPDSADVPLRRHSWLIHVADPLAERAIALRGRAAPKSRATDDALAPDLLEGLAVGDLCRAMPGGIEPDRLKAAAAAALSRIPLVGLD